MNTMERNQWMGVMAGICLGLFMTISTAMAQIAPQPLTSTPVRDATPAVAADRPTAGGPSTVRLPLRQLIGPEEPIYLQNASSTYTIYVPLSPRYEVRSCKLRLAFTNSIALLSERSVLRVVLNNRIIGQFYLTRDQPNHAVDLEIPVRFLEVGSNQLQFIVAQHYTLECEDPAAPELYTQILPDESYVEAVVTWNNVFPKLSLIRDLIDQKLWETYKFHVCMPGGSGASMTESGLAWGSVISQGVALNMDYRQSVVTTGNALLAGVDNIVVGTMNELTPFLTSTEVGSINGSFIAVKPLPGDPTRFLLIISGRSDEEVSQAVYAFSLINFPLPDSQYAQISRIDFPAEPFHIKNAPIRDPGIYSFRQLGMAKSESVKGFNTGTYQLAAYMPGDLSADDGSNIELRLHFVYGAALRGDSVMNVFVNREFQYAIRLDDVRGAMHDGHRVYLPVKAFQPGRNIVEVAPKMVPLVTDQCELQQVENLWFTLYNDSDFVVPPLQRKTRLPNFSVFSQTGFPFTASPDGLDLALYVTSPDNTTICAAWMLLGKLAQINGSILNRAEVSFRLPKSKKNLLVVGAVDTLPDELMMGAPVSPQQIGRSRYLVSVSPKPEATATGPVEEIIAKLRGTDVARSEPEQPATVNMEMTSELQDDTVAISWQNPFHVGMATTVFTAADSEKLYRGLFNLQDRRFWDNLSGNVAVWNTTPRSLVTARMGPEFLYGIGSVVTQAANRFNSNPLLFAVIVFGALGLLAFLFSVMLSKREKKK